MANTAPTHTAIPQTPARDGDQFSLGNAESVTAVSVTQKAVPLAALRQRSSSKALAGACDVATWVKSTLFQNIFQKAKDKHRMSAIRSVGAAGNKM